MSDKDLARRTKAKVYFAGVDISSDINKYLVSLEYTDNAEDEADDLQIVLEDREDLWLCQWLADAINAAAAFDTASGILVYKVTAAAGVSVRSGPGTSYSKLGMLPFGAEFEVSAVASGWVETFYSGALAYVSVDYITDITDTYMVTAIPQGGASAVSVKGMELQASIVRENWNGDGIDVVLDCGVFELDTVDADGPPSKVTIKGTSLPFLAPVRQTKKSCAWIRKTLREIAAGIASQNGMALMFESDSDPYYERVEQVDQSDIGFLQALCKRAGIALKASSKMLVLFEEQTYEQKAPVRTIRKGDGSYKTYKLSTSESDVKYSACHLSYTDPETHKTFDYTYRADSDDSSDQNGQVLEIHDKVASKSEAMFITRKRLRQKNKFERKASFSFPGAPDWVAGVTVVLDTWGAFSGKYIVRKASHSLSKGNGYETDVDLRQVLEGY
jgi:phage protein D/uncharacterized protein YraI